MATASGDGHARRAAVRRLAHPIEAAAATA